MVLIESDGPIADTRLIDPCSLCHRDEGVFSVPWPDAPRYEFALLCHRCVWRKFTELPRGPVRRALARKVLGARRMIKADDTRGRENGDSKP